MADVFSMAFAAEQHAQWAANQFAWDPSQLHLLPTGSPGSVSDAAPSEQGSEGLGSSPIAPRDQSLGPLPVGWQETSRGGPGAKETKGAHTRAPKGPLVCQVEGCGHDLSLEKGYYQRYRVCEPHMKLLSLVVNGKACRFCQQCGRFQELTEFDGNKRSCRARLLQHNARRRKRDPLDTSRNQPSSRKSKSLHPWSDSSNDADMPSGDVGHGIGMADKSMTNRSLDSGVDQSAKARMAFGPLNWTGGLSGMTAHDAVEPPASVNQPLGSQQPLSMADQQPVPMPQSINADLARCFSGAAELGGALDEMLDGILGSSTDYLDDPRMVGLMPAGDVRGSFTGPSLGGPVSGGVGVGMPFGDGPSSQFEMMAINSQGLGGPMSGQGAGLGGPTSGAWQSGGMVPEPGPASATDLAAALNKRAMQQRQLQELQLQQHQHQQQHFLMHQQQQQQQLLMQQGRAGLNMGGSSMMQLDGNYVNSNSSVVSGGCGHEPGLGAVGMSNGPTSGQGIGGVHALNRGNVGPWSVGNNGTPVSGPQLLSGGVALHANLSHGPLNVGLGAAAAPAVTAASSASTASSFDLARRLVASGGAAAKYESEDLLVRVSIKIANCTPDQLPPDLYQRLRNLLNTADASLVQGFLRPGCTHLVLDVQVGRGAGAADNFDDGFGASATDGPALAVPVEGIRALLGSVACRSPVLIQTEEQVSLWPAGAALSAKPSTTASVPDLQTSGSLPTIEHVSAAAHVDAEGRAALVVYGTGLARQGVSLFARMQGGYLPVSAKPLALDGAVVAESAAASAALRCMEALQRAGRKATDAVLVTVDCAPGTGLLFIEAQAGPLLSNSRPCLLVADTGMAVELSRVESRVLRAGAAALTSLQAFVTDLGLVLDRRSYTVASPPGMLASVASDPGDGEDEEADTDAYTPPDDGALQGGGDVTLSLVCVCERLLAWAADLGTARVASFLAAALRQYGQDMQAILEAPYADGLSVVHRCVRSGNPEVVRALMHWASSSRVPLAWGSVGSLGLSPLHLAALIPTTWRLLAATPAARVCWETSAAAMGGPTPAQLQRVLVARLPRGVLPPEVVHAFAPPQRHMVPQAAAPAPVSTVCEDEKASVSPGAAPAGGAAGRGQRVVPPMVGIASTILVFAMAAILFALQPAASRARGATDASARALRNTLLHRVLAPEYEGLVVNCCTSMLYLGLLGMAAYLLPVKTMVTGVHPASTCLGA